MSNPNENESQNETKSESKKESFLSNLMKFLFIFFILGVIVILIPFTGILNDEETTSSASLASIQTLPPITTTETQTVATTTVPTTTETTPVFTTETTAESSTYPPATVPTFITQTTASTTLATTTRSPDTDPVSDPLDISDEAMEELIEVRYLSIHDDSRPGVKLWRVDNIVVHYVANPGSTADQNWRNFENNKPGTSAHFIIGLEGEIIQCMPLDEVAWAIGTEKGNYTSISIECCHPDATGKFTDATLESLTKLVSWLCNKLDLGRDDVVRHYDYPRQGKWGLWHKECPLYYADADDPASHKRWEEFKDSLLID